VLEQLDARPTSADVNASDVEPHVVVWTMDGGGEDLRHLPEPALLQARRRLVAAAEAGSTTGLDLTEHEQPRAFDHEVEFAESASPVPRDDVDTPTHIEGD